MKTLMAILLFSSLMFAQRPPDEKLTYSSAVTVNDALNKAMAAITGSGVANQLTYWTGTGSIGSLPTASYPNLAELSYLKGTTSSVQTQLNSKQATLVSGSNIKTLNGQSLLGGGNITVSGTADTTGLYQIIYNIVQSILPSSNIIGTTATLDSMIIDFRKNNYLRLNK
jgi:hypothetical protein